MRVLMLLYGRYPEEPRSRRAAEALTEAGYTVSVLCLGSVGDPACETVAGVEVIRTPLPAAVAIADPVTRKLQTIRKVKAVHDAWLAAVTLRSFDVVHAHNLDTLETAISVARRTHARMVYDAHELWVDYVGDRGPGLAERMAAVPTRAYWAAAERRLLPRVDAVITVNQFIAREMVRRYGCAAPDVVMNVPVSPADGIEPLPVSMPGMKIIYQGALSAGRGLPELLDAVARVPDASVAMMGCGALAGLLRERAARDDVSGRAFVLDAVSPERVVPIARSADVGVIPFQPTTLNNRLASPNKLFEYMHAGLAIVATDLPFIAQVLEETGAGVTVPPADVDGWARRIACLARDRDALDRLRANSAEAAARYTWDLEKQKLLAVYDRIRPLSAG